MTTNPAGRSPSAPGRPSAVYPVWKKTLLATSLSAIVLGWALLFKPKLPEPAVTVSPAVTAAPVTPRLIIVRAPIVRPAPQPGVEGALASSAEEPVASAAPLQSAVAPQLPVAPKRPEFQAPVAVYNSGNPGVALPVAPSKPQFQQPAEVVVFQQPVTSTRGS